MSNHFSTPPTGIILVDHGSRRVDSNQTLERFAAMFQASRPDWIIEPAHMELAEPTIRTAFDRCVERGARFVVVAPYFLAPGKHWREDIPALAAQAAAHHADISYLVTAPIGLHPLMCEVVQERIEQCLAEPVRRPEDQRP